MTEVILDNEWRTNINPRYYDFRKTHDGDYIKRFPIYSWKKYNTIFCDMTIYEDGYIDIDVMTENGMNYGLFYNRQATDSIVVEITKKILKILKGINAYTESED